MHQEGTQASFPTVTGRIDNLGIMIATLPEERWQDYKTLRLRALSEDSTAFSSSYEEEVKNDEGTWRSRMANGLFALDDNRVIGMIGVIFNSRVKTRHVASIVSVYVDPTYRRSGVGQSLMEAAINRVKANHEVLKIELTVNPEQPTAVRLYEKNGFQVSGKQTKELYVNGTLYDELYMELLL